MNLEDNYLILRKAIPQCLPYGFTYNNVYDLSVVNYVSKKSTRLLSSSITSPCNVKVNYTIRSYNQSDNYLSLSNYLKSNIASGQFDKSLKTISSTYPSSTNVFANTSTQAPITVPIIITNTPTIAPIGLSSYPTIYHNTGTNSGTSNLSSGAIAGIVVGCVAFVIIVAMAIYLIIFKRKNILQWLSSESNGPTTTPTTNDTFVMDMFGREVSKNPIVFSNVIMKRSSLKKIDESSSASRRETGNPIYSQA